MLLFLVPCRFPPTPMDYPARSSHPKAGSLCACVCVCLGCAYSQPIVQEALGTALQTPLSFPSPPRYPVVLRTFQLVPNTGGAGLFRGGDGVQRELQFREEMVLSVLSERRAFQPYGLQGGAILGVVGGPSMSEGLFHCPSVGGRRVAAVVGWTGGITGLEGT